MSLPHINTSTHQHFSTVPLPELISNGRRHLAPLLLPRIRQVKYLPLTIVRFYKMKGIYAAVTELLVQVKGIFRPHLRKNSIDMNNDIPDRLVPGRGVRR